MLDDNVLGCPNWKTLLEELIATGRKFKFKQGLDERLLTDERCKLLFSANYDGDYTFAFDNIADYDLIQSKLEMIRQYTDTKYIKFYVLLRVLVDSGLEDLTYEQIGSYLCSNDTAFEARRKYGETH